MCSSDCYDCKKKNKSDFEEQKRVLKEELELRGELNRLQNVLEEFLNLLDREELKFRRRGNQDTGDEICLLSHFLSERIANAYIKL
jgi:hypothetical protein